MSTLELMITLPIGKFGVGDMFSGGAPLPYHCTVMPWFSLPGRLARAKTVQDDTSHFVTSGITLTSTEIENYGPDLDVRAYTLEQTDSLLFLHYLLLKSLERLDVTISNEEWVGRGYKPHVTLRGEDLGGVSHTATEMLLVQRHQDGFREIMHSSPLV